MRYKEFTLTDFLEDSFFVTWVLNPSQESDFFWNGWLEENPDKLELINQARTIIESFEYSNEKPSQVETNEVLENILKKTEEIDSGRKTKIWRIAMSYAAALAIVLLSIGFFWEEWQKTPLSKEEDTLNTKVTKQTLIGQKALLVLEDGTKVMLNSGSSISYSANFRNNAERLVELTGEAFFDVSRDTLRPFVVRTGRLTTTALGTSFNIKSYEDEDSEISLFTGSVAVKNVMEDEGVERILLAPGQSAVLKEGSTALFKSTFDVTTRNLWTKNTIYFDNTPLDQTLKTLERWYSVTIAIENLPADREFFCFGVFHDDNLDNVLNSIGYLWGFEHEIEDRKVTLKFKKQDAYE